MAPDPAVFNNVRLFISIGFAVMLSPVGGLCGPIVLLRFILLVLFFIVHWFRAPRALLKKSVAGLVSQGRCSKKTDGALTFS